MFKRAFVTAIYFIMLIYVSSVYAAGKREGHVCDADFVAGKVGNPDWVILDGRGGDEYQAGHIPRAVNYGKPVVVTFKHPVDGRIVSVQEAEKLLGQIGLDNNKGLIIYGTKGDYHVTIEQLPIYLGVKEFCFLDGGYEAYEASGKKVETGKFNPTPDVFKAKISNPEFYITTEEMIGVVKNKNPKVTLIDVRSPKEYNAEENTTLRGGRIPGAINIPVDKNIDAKTGKMLSQEKLKEVYKNIPKDSRVILYCHRGCRTAFTYYALENLGYKDVSIYEDGYIVWGARNDTPVENEHYTNMRPVVLTIESLKKRLDELEAKIK
ncbi:MAG: Rhodanese domain-containing protein [Nitrospirae bacterium]|nr:MAG: Rhodanese domain-containing protein [Nitrospirota bacterium]